MDDEFDIYNDLEDFDWQQKYLEQSDALKEEQSKALTALNKISILETDILKIKQVNEILKNNLAVTLTTFGKEVTRKEGQILQLRKEKDNICFRRAPPTNNYKIPKKNPSFSVATQTDIVLTTIQTDLVSCENSKNQNDKNYSKNKKLEVEKDEGKYKNYNNNVRDRLDLTNKKRPSDFNDSNSRLRTNERFYGTSNEKKYSNERHYNRRNDERCDKRKWNEDGKNSRDYQKRGRYEKNDRRRSQKDDDEDLMKLQEKLAEIRQAMDSENVEIWEPEDEKPKKLENFENVEKKSERMSPNNQMEEDVLEFSCKLPPLPGLSEDLQAKTDLPEEPMSDELLNIKTNEKVPEDNELNDKEHSKKISIEVNVPEDESCKPTSVLSEILLPQIEINSVEPVLSDVPENKSGKSKVAEEIMPDEKLKHNTVESSLLESSEDFHKKGKKSKNEPVSSKDLHKKINLRDQVPEEILVNEKCTEKTSKESKRNDRPKKSVRSRSRSNETVDKNRTKRKDQNKISDNKEPEIIQIHKQVPEEILTTESSNPEEQHKKSVRSRSRSNETDKNRTKRKDEYKTSDNKEPENIPTESSNPEEQPKKSRSRSNETFDKNRTIIREENMTSDYESKNSKESTLSEQSDDLHKKTKRLRRMSVYCNKEEQQKISESDETISKLPERKKSKMSRRMSIFFGDESLADEEDSKTVEKSKNIEIPENHSDINLIINKKTGKVRKSSECVPTSPSGTSDSKEPKNKSTGRHQKESMETKNLEQVPEAKLPVPELENETISLAVTFVESVLPIISEISSKNNEVDDKENDLQQNSQSSVHEEKPNKKSEKARKTKEHPEKVEATKNSQISEPVAEQLTETSENTNSKIQEPLIADEKSFPSSTQENKNTEKSKKHKTTKDSNLKPEDVKGNENCEKSEGKPGKTWQAKNRKSSEKRSNNSSKDVPQITITASSRKSFDAPKVEKVEPPVLHSILRTSKTPVKNKKVRISEEFITDPITPVIEIEDETSPKITFNSIEDLLNTPMKPVVSSNEEVKYMKSRRKTSKSNKNNSKKEEVLKNEIFKLIDKNTEDVCLPQKEMLVESVVQTEEAEKINSEIVCNPPSIELDVKIDLTNDETEKTKSICSFTVLGEIGNETVIMLNRKRKKKKK